MSGAALALPQLEAEDFTDFYRLVHDHDPFPWQQALTGSVLTEGRWPDLVDVPTGLGKTSLLDIAVFVAAATAHHTGAERVGRRRCLFVVDRRVVVDEVTVHARKIQRSLARAEHAASDGIESALIRVAAGLRRLSGTSFGDGQPITVTKMRGGTTWSSAWAERPDLPGLVIGTVDQVGSRLLFRGYGVGNRRRPVDAALVGSDALLLVDEAHLATALLNTVRAAADRDHSALPLPGLDVVRMSATARRDGGTPSAREPEDAGGTMSNLASSVAVTGDGTFRLDVPAHLAVPEAARRLTAAKTLKLLQIPSKQMVTALADMAVRLTELARGPESDAAPVVLLVCNTVDRAREVHVALQAKATAGGTGGAFDLMLLIGRSRPVDRAGLEERVRSRFGADARRSARPAVLVSTQTVEVGVNLDVDALVTESASWDALVQRFGRLNRFGRHHERFPGTGSAVAVVVHDGAVEGPVYGAARDRTWEHLCALTTPATSAADLLTERLAPGVGVSPLDCRDLISAMPESAFMSPSGSPIVTTPILDRWVCTAPVPTVDPPIEPYLHGFDSGSAAVTVAWRAGLLAPERSIDLESGPIDGPDEHVNDLLTAIPLRAGEQIEVPLVAVRRWAAGEPLVAVSDLETTPVEEGTEKHVREAFSVWVRRDDAQAGTGWRLVDARGLRSGDAVLVACERGGVDRYGWNPRFTDPATDVSEAAAVDAGRLMLRVDSALGQRLGLSEVDRAAVTRTIAALITARRDQDDPDAGRSAGTGPESGEDEDLSLDDLGVRELVRGLLSKIREGLEGDGQQLAPSDGVQAPIWHHQPRREELRRLLGQAIDAVGSQPTAARLIITGESAASRGPGGRAPTRDSGQATLVLTWRPPDSWARPTDSSDPGLERDDDDPVSTSVGVQGGQVTLEQHLGNVRSRAEQIAERLGLGTDLTTVIGDAAGWHDLGKVEARFQIMLHGGDSYEAAIAEQPLAKSGMDPEDRAAWRLAQKESKLPTHARHEAWSAALVREYLAELRQLDRPYQGDADLLLHLVASHHGHARPLLPLVVDNEPRGVDAVIEGVKVQAWSADTVDIGHPERFATLNDRYGRWGLALLEAVVRCADMTVSAEGS